VREISDLNYQAAANTDVSERPGIAGAVDDMRAGDNDVEGIGLGETEWSQEQKKS
jgi:hypothetical protein